MLFMYNFEKKEGKGACSYIISKRRRKRCLFIHNFEKNAEEPAVLYHPKKTTERSIEKKRNIQNERRKGKC